MNGQYEIIKLLLDANANVNQKDWNGHNALHYATRSNSEKVVKLICTNKVESNTKTKTNQMLPLGYSLATVSSQINYSNIDKEYLKQNKSIQRSLAEDGVYQTASDWSSCHVEDRVLNIIQRYNDLVLSDIESDDGDGPKGDVYKKGKKKKKGKKSGKKGKKAGGGKKKKKK